MGDAPSVQSPGISQPLTEGSLIKIIVTFHEQGVESGLPRQGQLTRLCYRPVTFIVLSAIPDLVGFVKPPNLTVSRDIRRSCRECILGMKSIEAVGLSARAKQFRPIEIFSECFAADLLSMRRVWRGILGASQTCPINCQPMVVNASQHNLDVEYAEYVAVGTIVSLSRSVS
jgi:hypothetical protein